MEGVKREGRGEGGGVSQYQASKNVPLVSLVLVSFFFVLCMAVPGVEKCFVGQIGVGHLLGAHRGAKQTSTNLFFVLMYALD